MTENEIDIFIEEMDNMGDHWEREEVENVYGDRSLEDALDDRRGSLIKLAEILGTVFGN